MTKRKMESLTFNMKRVCQRNMKYSILAKISDQFIEMRQFFLGFFVLTLLVFSTDKAFSQISASETEGCAPLASVVFTNSYTSPSNIQWDFDDGATSNLPNPTHSFANPGVYNVTFTATVGGSTVNASVEITVYANPEASFTTNPELGACLGSPINFTDESVGGSGSNITQWQWDYGNGTTGNFGANPAHTYNNAGVYQVTLVVTDANGCTDANTVPGAVVISEPPNINIGTTPDPPASCEAPLNVSFTNNSSSNSPTGGDLTYDWNFGNGETGSAEVPAPVTYDDEGVYTITVTATDNVGCSATQNIQVTVQEPEASISVVGAENGVVCSLVEIEIEGTQGGFFNYGDGTSGSSLFHNYASEGEYTITYSVNVSGCSAEASTTINVEIPTAEISSDPGFACFKPAPFTYSLESDYDIEEYDWSIGNGSTTSTDPNPTAEMDYDGPNEYAINGLIIQFTSVSFVTANGCPGNASIVDSIALPNALIYPDTDQGCAPLTVNFENESSYIFPDNIDSYQWHYGDGTVTTIPDDDPTQHTYNNPGEYEAFLILTTTEGCIDTSFFHTIEVGEDVAPTFEIEPETVCPGEPFQITNTSAADDLIDSYSYSGDMNTLSGCLDEDSPTFVFNDFAGSAEVTQYAEYNGCVSSSVVEIEVGGPVGKISYGCNCETPYTYTFTAETYEADYWTWTFGDGVTIENSTDQTIEHTYDETGDFVATITTFNDESGCGQFVDALEVKVRDLSAEINIPAENCAGVDVGISAVNLQDVAGDNDMCYRNYLWDFGDNTRPIKTTGPNTEHAFQGGGDYTVTLSVKDDNECVYTTTREISVFDINANYSADTLYGCPPLEVNFSDLSTADTTITNWNWNFDDGANSTESNPTHLFENIEYDNNNNPIPFTVSLLVTDALGCVDQIDDLVIQPLGPNPEFDNTSSNEICAGDAVSFSPTGSNPAFHNYEWDFGNGDSATDANASSVFTESGTYSVTLSVTDSIGCERIQTEEIVYVQDYPQAIIGTNFDDGEILCYPFVGNFSNASVNEAPNEVTWNVDQLGTISGQETVGTTYLEPGFYDVSLEVSTTYGCLDDTLITVEVQGPVAELDLNPDAICPGGSIELNLTDTADLAYWQFDFGDGNEAANEWPTLHTYEPDFIPQSGSTVLTLVMFSEDSVCSSARTTDLVIEEVIAGFDRNNEIAEIDSIHCFGTEDVFTSTSTPNATSYFWEISTGQTFGTASPPGVTLPPGEHTVTLIVNSNLGCADTISKGMEIFPLPEPTVNEGAICQGETIELTATGGIFYEWSPPTGLDDPLSQTVQATPNSSTLYTVTVTDGNDCSNTAESDILVYQPPPSISADTTLRIGDTDVEGFYIGEGYTYQWTPNIDLECDTCAVTTFRPLEDRMYTLTISDTLGCFSIESYFFYEILEVASVVVPDAFTPNGDGVNDIVYVEGWGIEELVSFKIYNRWGELIFESNDKDTGWDGTYKGNLQAPDSYAYVVVAKNFIYGTPETLTGFIDLVR